MMMSAQYTAYTASNSFHQRSDAVRFVFVLQLSDSLQIRILSVTHNAPKLTIPVQYELGDRRNCPVVLVPS